MEEEIILEEILALLPAALQLSMSQGNGSTDEAVIKKAIEIYKKTAMAVEEENR